MAYKYFIQNNFVAVILQAVYWHMQYYSHKYQSYILSEKLQKNILRTLVKQKDDFFIHDMIVTVLSK